MGNQGGKALKWLPAHFKFERRNAPKSERERPSTLRDWPPCPPIQRDGGRRSGPGVNPFISALTVARCPATFPGVWPQLWDTLELLTKWPLKISKQIQSQIPPQGHIRLDSLLDLTLGGYSVQKAHQQIFHQHHRVDGRPPIPPAI